ncbi:putative LPS assembly protein LptD [Pseudochryseolinea flava]|uniref:LPS-assembly protein LptD n=1 Tax=Pseudochryseolinea flava TaxID=2059302 RepID=A0A364XTQ1_9BACT|nr:putative LPS assembly protein LptD [Pseudochryseolinea flava]RAV97731.1 LPS-assembly protein LptD [Pseudochryseolinea flava]
MRPLIVTIFILFNFQVIQAQVRPNLSDRDSTNAMPSDSVRQSLDSLVSDSTKVKPPKGDIETTINYSARDSIRASMNNQMVWLYGDAKIVYGDIELEADEIEIDYAAGTLTAHGTRDSTGQRVGYPVFKNGAEVYETKDIVYNFKTKRARISEVVTKQDEGFLHAYAAFKNEKNEILSIRNRYTTCDLEHPHFVIRSTKTKAIPKDKIVSGPFYLEFNDIPLPIGFLFGMFPSKRESASGIIFPSFGEERRRGFNLRNGGYFFDISDYVKLAVTGDIYSKGGHAVNANSNYIKRYKYSGSFTFGYSKNPDMDDKIETSSVTKDYRLTWSHSPQTKGSGRFAASVNAATATYTRNNNLMYGAPGEFQSSNLNNMSRKLSSNVSYNKRFLGTPFNMGINMRHDQDIITKVVDLTLPSLTFNMANTYPFQKKSGVTGPLDNFSISYAMTTSNRITNNLGRVNSFATRDSIAPFTTSNFSQFFKDGKKGMRHTIPMSYSTKVLKHFTVSPSVNYEEVWYDKVLEWAPNIIDGKVVGAVRSDTINKFNRIANYGFSTSLNTRIYGFFPFKKGKVKAIRHVMNPSLSFSYTPDFRDNKDYFTKITLEDGREELKSRHDGFVYGGSETGHNGSVGFSLGNNFEMKVQDEDDSVARKIMLLNNLSFSTSYNMIAEEFALAPISMSANTNILDNRLNVNLSAVLDPYTYATRDVNGVPTEVKIDRYVWKDFKLGRITSANLAMSTNLNPKKQNKDNVSREKIAKSELPESEKEYLLQNPDVYVDFEIPWSLNLSYNMNYSHGPNQDPTIRQSITASGTLALSEKWQITYSSGYDVQAKEFTTTNLGITRDLHCWTMNLNWTPFGYYASYNFRIAVKASILQDLKLERRKPFFDNL